MPLDRHFVCVQSVVADGHGALWVIDAAAPGNEKILHGGPKLVRIQLSTDKVTIIPFDEKVVLWGSYVNDLRVSTDGRTGYVTDSGMRGAIIVVDRNRGSAFRRSTAISLPRPRSNKLELLRQLNPPPNGVLRLHRRRCQGVPGS